MKKANHADTFQAALKAAGPPFENRPVMLQTAPGKVFLIFKNAEDMETELQRLRKEGHRIEAHHCYRSGQYIVFSIQAEILKEKAETFDTYRRRNLSEFV